jgi:UDP-N-acetylmuramoyl-tripeptide--D-alanyl-D-alanine ligase
MKSVFKNIISKVLEWEARLILAKYKPKIIAVTGSVGKTSTKDAIFSVMSTTFHIRKSEKSFNSDIGIPLTILGCQNAWLNPIMWLKNIIIGLELIFFRNAYPEWLVLEVGADRPGDIRNITKWLKPDVTVVTAFAKVPVHIEFFHSRDEVIREKRYLAEALKHDGVLIVNGDDEDALRIKDRSKNISLIYGTDKMCDLVASDTQIYYGENDEIEGITFKVEYEHNIVPIVMKGSLGAQNMYSALAALAVGISQKVNLIKGGEGLLNHKTPNGRMKIISGIKDTMIIDDTYNSSPVAAGMAVSTLKEIKTKHKKIAILADMMELGKHSTEEHYALGKQVADVVDILITVGIRSRKIAEGALDVEMSEKKIFQCDDYTEAIQLIKDIIKSGDVILVKGSQSTRMEKVVESIMAEPGMKNEVLVRQEEEWKNR